LPSYLFCICAGPFFEIKTENNYLKSPMNLYCRESISKYVIENKNLIMEATNKSIEFYEKFFQVKYQFPKYE